jgi:uncharacterized protein YifN (PemK superfamily)
MSFKKRPVLVVGQADSSDYVVLPISRVTNQSNLDSDYDLEMNPPDFKKMNLTQKSYIRTHKQTVLHAASLTKVIVDFRSEYPDTYLDVISRMEDFQKQLINNAI